MKFETSLFRVESCGQTFGETLPVSLYGGVIDQFCFRSVCELECLSRIEI